jgi:hypothetical protein
MLLVVPANAGSLALRAAVVWYTPLAAWSEVRNAEPQRCSQAAYGLYFLTKAQRAQMRQFSGKDLNMLRTIAARDFTIARPQPSGYAVLQHNEHIGRAKSRVDRRYSGRQRSTHCAVIPPRRAASSTGNRWSLPPSRSRAGCEPSRVCRPGPRRGCRGKRLREWYRRRSLR